MNKALLKLQQLNNEFNEACSVYWRVLNTSGDYYIICWVDPKTYKVDVKLVDLFMAEVSTLDNIPGKILCELGTIKDVVAEWQLDETRPYPERDERAEEAFNKVVNCIEEVEASEMITPLSLDPNDYT